MAIPFEKRWSDLFFVPVLVHIAVDGFLKRLDALAGNGADLVDFLLVYTGKVHKAVASLHIRVLAVDLGNDTDGRNVKGKDKIGRNVFWVSTLEITTMTSPASQDTLMACLQKKGISINSPGVSIKSSV